jgi:transcription antitermination factor NusG
MAAEPVELAAGRRWFVVHTLPHREFQAERNLSAQGFRAFLPAEWRTIRHARRFQTVKAALFSRYLFVELDLDRDRWRSVNGTFGVANMIMEGDRPKAVPPGIVEALLALRGQGEVVSFASELRCGQAVRLVSGPFAGAIGMLERLTSAARVQVLLNLMGGAIMLSLDRKAVAPAAA